MSDLNKKNINYGNLNRFYQNLKGEMHNYSAGENITISGDTISAVDTTYVAGQGINIEAQENSINVNKNLYLPSDYIDIEGLTYEDLPIEKKYFTIISRVDNNQLSGLIDAEVVDTINLEFSLDRVTWTTITYEPTGNYNREMTNLPSINTGEKCYFRGKNTYFGHYFDDATHLGIWGGGKYDVEGNLMSLVNYETMPTTLPSSFPNGEAFNYMFYEDYDLVDASNLTLGVNDNSAEYSQMFVYCDSLQYGPVMPSKNPKNHAYYYMFENCPSLKQIICLAETNISNAIFNIFDDWTTYQTSGTIIKSKNVDWTSAIREGSHIPSGWVEEDYKEDEHFTIKLSEEFVNELDDKQDALIAGEGIEISGNTISCTVKPITNVSALPDAEENKDKLFRLESDDNVYVSELKSRTVITKNRLPDAQQIDKAYIIENGNIYYYKGEYKIICADGEINGYGWLFYSSQEWALMLTKDNAVNTTENTLVTEVCFDDEGEPIVNQINNTITTSASTDYYGFDKLVDIESPIIPAIYNAPESAQIGNAYFVDGNNHKFLYGNYISNDASPFKIIVSDGEIDNCYGWFRDENMTEYMMASTKKASEIYYNDILTDTIIYDLGEYVPNGWEWNDEGTVLTNTGKSLSQLYVVNSELQSLYIPQLNAPDYEQVDNAYIDEDYLGGAHPIYTGIETTIEVDGNNITVYEWKSANYHRYSFYSTKPAYQIYNTDKDSEDVHFYIDEEGDISELTFADGDILSISTVKYQRTEVTEEWDWEKVATEQYVDDAISTVDVKPITNVSALPDAEVNKDSVLRLESDNKVYISYGSENASDYEQVGNAKITTISQYGNGEYVYSGKIWTLVLGNTQVSGYLWWGSEDVIISQNNAASFYDLNENVIYLWYEAVSNYNHVDRVITVNGNEKDNLNWVPLSNAFDSLGYTISLSIVKKNWKPIVTKDILDDKFRDGIDESTFTGATLTVDGSQPSIVASGSTTIAWVTPNVSGKTVEVSVFVINTGSSALTPTMSGNYQMMGDGNLTIQAGELGLYRGRYISALNKWLIEAIYQEVSGIAE